MLPTNQPTNQPTSINTPKLKELIEKLTEVFQIDRPDLDFGIYRILNSRQTQINQFLSYTLPQKIRENLTDASQQNSVYSHLLTFFSRYYEEGDFISQRRYKGETYAIPYNGEEVVLHWANKDQYYTKSGENFTNYRFSLDDDRQVEFRLVEADTAKDNRKDNGKDRRFVLAEYRTQIRLDENGEEIESEILPVSQSEDGKQLTIRFEYKLADKKQPEYVKQAVEKLTANEIIAQHWQNLFALAPTEKNANRTLLEKHLTDYTEKNSKDYFIHKDLGGFLSRELDFYIKNEMLSLDNLQAANQFADIEQNFHLIQTFRSVATQIIEFLAQLENFQKKLWLKKKFVSNVHYLITLDHIPESYYPDILENTTQIEQWQTLYSVNASGQNPTEFCQNHPHLTVDTSLFPAAFQAKLLAEFDDLDEQTNGVIIHSDNFQALNLLQARYKEQVKCIYIDPPYNTDGDGFMYKDSYKHSSWLTLMKDRGELSRKLLKDNGVFFFSIDEVEVAKAWELFNGIYGAENFSTDFVWQKKKKPSFLHRNIGKLNDYILCYIKNYQNTFPFSVEKTTEGKKTPINNAGNSLAVLEFEPNSVRFGILDSIVRAQNMSGGNIITELLDDVIIENGRNKNTLRLKGEWRYSQSKVNELIGEKADFYISQIPFRPNHIKDGGEIKKMKNLFSPEHYEMETNEDATSQHSNLFDSELFKNPKPEKLINYLIKSVTYDNEKNLILDYFAGSGTTAHAVINLNREDQGNRKYILVEQGEYFDTVLKPRIQKVVYSEKWKDGKPEKGDNGYNGVPQIVKVLKLESYEDTLNNLELSQPRGLNFSEQLEEDYLLHYMLNVESRGSLLNTDDFRKPFDYQLKITQGSAGAYQMQKVDLVETFNYLLGLRVRYIDDQREKRGLVLVEGDLPSGENTLIIWRDCEKLGYAEIAEFLESHHINPRDNEYDVVYLNGDHNIPTILSESENGEEVNFGFKLRPIEPVFLDLMFE